MKNKKRSDTKRVLSMLLTIYLVLLLLGFAFTATAQIIFNKTVSANFTNVPSLVFYITGTFALIYIVSIIALLKSKKWGFWLFLIMTVVSSLFNLYGRVPFWLVLMGYLPLLILYLLLKHKWKELK